MALLFLFVSCFAHAELPKIQFVPGPTESENHLIRNTTIETQKLSDDLKVKVIRLQQPLRETLQTLQEKYGSVTCDCGLFVQISAILNRADSPNPRVLLFPRDNRAEFIACACDQDLAYMHLTNQSHHLALQESKYTNKGHWLLPVDRRRLLGLEEGGPVVQSMGQWIKKAEGYLLEEHFRKLSCQSELSHDSHDWFEIQYVEAIRNIEETKRWMITPIRRSNIPKKQRALLKELFNQNSI